MDPGLVWMGAESHAPPPGFDPRNAQTVDNRFTDRAIPAHTSTQYESNLVCGQMAEIISVLDKCAR
jgi:hypothetical protein